MRLHGELRRFIPEGERALPFKGEPSLKHVLEGAGVPHPEVDWLLVDGSAASLDWPARGGATVDAGSARRALPAGEPWRFLLDCHLGRLAKHLRLLGFDTMFETHSPDDWLARVSAEEGRWLLTRDKALLFRSIIRRGYFVRSSRPREQLAEVLARHDCGPSARPLSRCLACNIELAPETLEKGLSEAPPKTRRWCREYFRCPACRRLYWKGSHYDKLLALVGAHLDSR